MLNGQTHPVMYEHQLLYGHHEICQSLLWWPRLRVLKLGANKEGGSVVHPCRAAFWVLLGSVQ